MTQSLRKKADKIKMNLEALRGQIFQENQIYETLHFDIEQNLKKYFSKFIHIYFDHLDANNLKIKEIIFLRDEDALYTTNKQIVGHKGWIEIYHHSNHIDLMLCRKDRSGKFSVIGPNINHVQTFSRNSYDLPTRTSPLTPEEERQAFAELAGHLDNHIQISKSKKAV